MLILSHKLLGLIDWKSNMAREYPKTKRKADLLYKERERAENELIQDIMSPERDELMPVAPPDPFPNLSKLVKNDSKVSIKIDDEPGSILPELTHRSNGPISVRAKPLPGFDDQRKFVFEQLTLRRRRASMLNYTTKGSGNKIKLNNLVDRKKKLLQQLDQRSNASAEALPQSFKRNPSIESAEAQVVLLNGKRNIGTAEIMATQHTTDLSSIPSA